MTKEINTFLMLKIMVIRINNYCLVLEMRSFGGWIYRVFLFVQELVSSADPGGLTRADLICGPG